MTNPFFEEPEVVETEACDEDPASPTDDEKACTCTVECLTNLAVWWVIAGYVAACAGAIELGVALGEQTTEAIGDAVLCAVAAILWLRIIFWRAAVENFWKERIKWYKEHPSLWLEGYIFNNPDAWAGDKSSVVRFPSMSDNIASFFEYVIGGRYCLVLLVMLPLAMLVNMALYGQTWRRRVITKLSFETVETFQNLPIGDIVFDARALCCQLGFVPLPYTYCVLKVVLLSFLQDVVFGVSDDLAKTKNEPLGTMAWAFSSATIFMVLLNFLRAYWHATGGAFGTSLWQMYQGSFFFVDQHSALGSLVLLTVKVFCECNVRDNTGAPPGLGRLLDRKMWQVPPLWKEGGAWELASDRIMFLYLCLLLLLLCYLPIFLTHLFPMFLVCLVGISFPLWGFVVAILELVWGLALVKGDWTSTPDVVLSAWSWCGVLSWGAELHAKIWGHASAVCFLIVIGVFLRKWLWEVHARVRILTRLVKTRNRLGAEDIDGHTSASHWFFWSWCPRYRTEEPATSEEMMSLSRSMMPESTTGSEARDNRRRAPSAVAEKLRGKGEPHGAYGYHLACYQILFTLPVLAYANAALSTAIACYSRATPVRQGWIKDFTSREVDIFNQCLLSNFVTLIDRALSFVGLF